MMTPPTSSKSARNRAITDSLRIPILVVDDDPDARELISQFVQDLGAKAIPCGHAPSALRMATEVKPDLITLDLMMPEKSGW